MLKLRFTYAGSKRRVIEFSLNGERQTAVSGTTLGELVERLDLKGRRFALERNGELIPKAEHAKLKLEPGDRIEVVIAVGGG